MVKLTQENFNELCKSQINFSEALNHRMTRIEGDVKWMKRIGYYMSTILTAIAIKSVAFS